MGTLLVVLALGCAGDKASRDTAESPAPEETGDWPDSAETGDETGLNTDSGATEDSASDDTGSADADALRAAAQGDCMRTGEEVEVGVGPLSTWEQIYDEYGWWLSQTITYEDVERGDDQVWEARYHAPGEMVSQTLTYPDYPYRGERWAFEWEDGDRVLYQYDEDDDGDYEEVGVYLYEEHRLIYWEWDLDEDGEVDDYADFTWTPDGDGWSVRCLGEDAYGTYRCSMETDTLLREYVYTYEDSTGISGGWTVESYSPLDETGDLHAAWYIDGLAWYEEDYARAFDAEGRKVGETYTFTYYEDGEFLFDSVLERTFTFACP